MSAVDQAGQPPAAAAPSWPGRVLRWLLGTALVLFGAAAVAVCALAWLLSRGPLDVTGLAHWAAPRLLSAPVAASLGFGAVRVGWRGLEEGAASPVDVQADAVSYGAVRLAHAEISLAAQPLLWGSLSPISVALSGLRGEVATDGTAGMGGPAPDAMAQALGEPPSPSRGGDALAWVSGLRQVRVTDAQVTLVGPGEGRRWPVSLDAALDRLAAGGVDGRAQADVGVGEAQAHLALTAALAAGGGTHVEASLSPLQFSALGAAVPEAAAVQAAVSGTATLDLSPELLPREAKLDLAAGAGRLALAPAPLEFQRLALAGFAKWDGSGWLPRAATVSRAEAVLVPGGGGAPTTLSASADGLRNGGDMQANLHLLLDRVAMADLPALWPAAWGGNVRPWLVANVTGGTLSGGDFTVAVAAKDGNPGNAEVVGAGGKLVGEDLTVHWLRPVPPIEHARALLTVVNPDRVDIAVPGGSQGPLRLHDGVLRFTGLSGTEQTMAATAGITGAAADVLALLKNKRLHLFDKQKLELSQVGGELDGKLSVTMPLKKELPVEELSISSTGRLTGLVLGKIAADRDLRDGDFDYVVDQNGLEAKGSASIAGIATALDVAMDFRSGPPSQVLQRITLSGQASVAELRRAGADPSDLMGAGRAELGLRYEQRRSGAGSVAVRAGLTGAGLSVLGWHKAPGAPATLNVAVSLDHERLVSVERLEAVGPGLSVLGSMGLERGRAHVVRVERAVVGPSQMTGEVVLPASAGEPIRIKLAGPQLDVAEQLSSLSPGVRGGGGGTPWEADIRFDRVVLGPDRVLTGVSLRASDDGKRLQRLDASSTGPERLRALLTPTATGRRLQAWAADVGVLLQAAGMGGTITRGKLAVDAEFDDRQADPPLAGTVDLSDFAVHDAVAIGKTLQAMTIYGIGEALTGTGVQFARLIMPFRYAKRQLLLGQTRAFSPSLGLTAQGWVDFPRRILDIRGTVVPAYAINAALGKIPLVGRLFTVERGGGLIAVNYAVTGRLDSPRVGVNPLSALTPGILRGIFGIFR